MNETAQHSDSIKPLLELSGISKNFPGVRALSQVSLELYPGQVTALVGENGAGKSTIVKILTGIYQPDDGRIDINQKQTRLSSPQVASQVGITAIHQETVMFDNLSVAENIFIGHAPKNMWGLIQTKKMHQDAKQLLERIGANLDPSIELKNLGIASKHLVGIARALSVNTQVVIMDEPTAALSYKEIEELYVLIERLKAEGKAILFISHKFDEIYRIADRYTVFRDGEMIGKGLLNELKEAELVKMMVGRDVTGIFPQRTGTLGETVLEVKHYSHPTEFDEISFSLRRGEILGFYGLVGAGRSELMQCLFGISESSNGALTLDNRTLHIKNPTQAIDNGIVYVPEDRGGQGVVTGLPIFENITLPSLNKLSNRGFLSLAKEFSIARSYSEKLELRAASLDQHVELLSGGNQQKVVIAKWLATQPKVIILDEPTKGIDIGSKAAVHAFMRELADDGLAVIIVSSEIPEVIGMSDRIIVMREGLMVAEYSKATVSPELIVRDAAGIAEHVA